MWRTGRQIDRCTIVKDEVEWRSKYRLHFLPRERQEIMKSQKIKFGVSLPHPLVEKLNDQSQRKNINRSAIVRLAVEQYFQSENQNPLAS